MSIFAIHAIRSNGIVAAGQTAHRGSNLLLTIGLSAVLLAACGGGSGGGGSPPPPR